MAKEAPKTKSSVSEQIEALSKISKAITSDLYLEDILKLIVTVTAEVMGSKICSLMLIDGKTGEIAIRATQSICEEYNRKPPLKIGEGISGKVAKENRPAVIYDVTNEKEYKYKDIANKEGLKSLLCVPLAVGGKVIGVINLYTTKPHRFTKNEINILTAVANQAAIVIDRTQLMVESKVVKEELEARKYIERAKGVLMREEGLSEDGAFRKIQKFAMDNRKSMRDVAEAILMANDMKKRT
jgi:signal transduction protein with GAF and PtsI domain